ncbi:hypothetical protein XI05_09150 [Bradyrhizobium sp. CCBAU 11357]|nr:hypothetical protein [Bradyrhizobium sp. CCBAU 11357]
MKFRRLLRRRKIALEATIDKTAAIACGRLTLRKKSQVDHAEWRNKARERARVHFAEHGVALRMWREGSQIQFIDHVSTPLSWVSKQPSAARGVASRSVFASPSGGQTGEPRCGNHIVV